MKSSKTLLVATDFSEASGRLAEPTRVLANAWGAKILLVHVSEPFTPFIDGGYLPLDLEGINRAVHARASEQLEQVAREFAPGLEVERASLIGVPHVEIVKLAAERGADLIVMASHGRGFVSHALLGSTTEKVLRRAPCPVLVIPAAR